MTVRDRRLLLGLAALSACLTLAGLPSDVLLAAPLLCAAIPLLAGRYLGEEQLARLASYVASRRRPAAARRRMTPRGPGRLSRSPRLLPRGGSLIASSLAQRPPPVPVLLIT